MEQTFEISFPEDRKEKMKYDVIKKDLIKNIEKVVRYSYHYKILIYYLKNFMDLSKCAYYEGYSMSNGLGVELHHSPITLYEYVYAVTNKHLKQKGYYKINEVAKEVSKLHYSFKVGLVPLNPTAHKLVHAGELKIHPDIVKGDWESFMIEYQDWVSDDLKNTIDNVRFQKEHENYKDYPKILKRSETHYIQTGVKSILDINVGKLLTEIKLKQLESV